MRGYTEEQAIIEVASIDGVSVEEAAERIRLAREQSARRSDAQRLRRWREADKLRAAHRLVLAIAQQEGCFICARDLQRVALLLPGRRLDTGKAFRRVCLPLEKAGLVAELLEDGRFVGYVLTDKGAASLQA